MFAKLPVKCAELRAFGQPVLTPTEDLISDEVNTPVVLHDANFIYRTVHTV